MSQSPDLVHFLDWLSFLARGPYLKLMCVYVSLLPLLQVDLPHFLDWLSFPARDPYLKVMCVCVFASISAG